ncbi:MAG: thioredoxin family protein [Planctomycetota bacterium]
MNRFRRAALPASLGLIAAILAAPLCAQRGPSQEELQKRKAKKLTESFVSAYPWQTDFDAARAAARESGKPIFAYFTRSYEPCPFCTKFENGALQEEGFPELAEEVELFLHVSTRVDGDNDDLFREKGGTEYPHLALLDAEGRVVGRVEGNKRDGFTVGQIRESLENDVREFRELETKAADGDSESQHELFKRRVEYGHFLNDYDQAREQLAELEDFSDEQRATFEAELITQEFNQILAIAQDQSRYPEAGAQALTMHKKDRIVDGDLKPYYWSLVGVGAAGARDAERLLKSVEILEGIDHAIARRALRQLKPIAERMRG